MIVAMCAPWLVKCGVASYSYYLANALGREGCDVKVVRMNRFGVRDEYYFRNYAEEVPLDVDVIHVQHEYGLFDWMEEHFYRTLKDRMTERIIPIVTTMHATGNLRVDRVVRDCSQEVIVHNQFGKGQFTHPCAIIPMGVQKVKTATPEASKRRWAVKGNTVGFFGFLSPYKGLEDVIAAVAELPDVTLLVGGGWHIQTRTPYINHIKQYADTVAPGKVRWLDYITSEDEPYYFGACDIMVFGHKFISESMSLLTALAYGKPTIARGLPSFREKERFQVIATFQTVPELKGKIAALLKEPKLRDVLIKKATLYAETNSWSKTARKHISLYDSLITVGARDSEHPDQPS